MIRLAAVLVAFVIVVALIVLFIIWDKARSHEHS